MLVWAILAALLSVAAAQTQWGPQECYNPQCSLPSGSQYGHGDCAYDQYCCDAKCYQSANIPKVKLGQYCSLSGLDVCHSCASGLTCQNGMCMALVGKGVGCRCFTDSECTSAISSQLKCIDNVCQPKRLPEGAACVSNTQCSGSCVNSVCTGSPLGQPCVTTGDTFGNCTAGTYCVSGYCIALQASGTSCADSTTCAGGQNGLSTRTLCDGSITGTMCTARGSLAADSACLVDEACASGLCNPFTLKCIAVRASTQTAETLCDSDDLCASGTYCSTRKKSGSSIGSQACTTGSRYAKAVAAQCAYDDECVVGSYCTSGSVCSATLIGAACNPTLSISPQCGYDGLLGCQCGVGTNYTCQVAPVVAATCTDELKALQNSMGPEWYQTVVALGTNILPFAIHQAGNAAVKSALASLLCCSYCGSDLSKFGAIVNLPFSVNCESKQLESTIYGVCESGGFSTATRAFGEMIKWCPGAAKPGPTAFQLGLGIGIGVGVPVFATAFALTAYCCYRRGWKKAGGVDPPKQPKKKADKKSNDKKGNAKKTDSKKESNKNGKKKQADAERGEGTLLNNFNSSLGSTGGSRKQGFTAASPGQSPQSTGKKGGKPKSNKIIDSSTPPRR